MRSNYKKIGTCIRKVNVRNSGLTATTLLGINIDKFFMPSVANIVGTDMSAYKIVKRRQFSCNRMHVGRDYRLPISISTSEEEFLVSPAYDVFEVKNEEEILPEYLMMWFLRKEFDRNSWFYTDADVRGGLHWDAFCDMELPIPLLGKQREIVKEYNVVKDRIELNNKLIQKLEETAQAIYRQWFVDFEFPDEDGKPYKSSGGEMDNINEVTLSNYVIHSKQIINPSTFSETVFDHYSIPAFDESCLPKSEMGIEIRSNKYVAKDNSILISKLNPNFSRVWSLFGKVAPNSICSSEFQVLLPISPLYFGFVLFFLKSDASKEYLTGMSTGTSNSHQRITPDNLLDMPIHKFDVSIIEKFNSATIPFIQTIKEKRDENSNLEKFKNLLLSKLATVNNLKL